ncbi:MAG: WYL domain-containing protein, partial [Pseudomonadota bacterium]|nr:WYL domain-containing protein [Pseudomonadota bacterium]
MLADDQIEVKYLAMGKEQAKILTLNPLGLVQCGPVSYLVATAFAYMDARLYAVHRITGAKRLPPGVRQLIRQLLDFVRHEFKTLHYNRVNCCVATGFFTRRALNTSLCPS